MRIRPGAGAVSQTFGSSSTCAPSSRRPSRSISSTLPCTGQRQKARRALRARVDPRAVPRQRVTLVPAPLLRPELEVCAVHACGGCRSRKPASQVAMAAAAHGQASVASDPTTEAPPCVSLLTCAVAVRDRHPRSSRAAGRRPAHRAARRDAVVDRGGEQPHDAHGGRLQRPVRELAGRARQHDPRPDHRRGPRRAPEGRARGRGAAAARRRRSLRAAAAAPRPRAPTRCARATRCPASPPAPACRSTRWPR